MRKAEVEDYQFSSPNYYDEEGEDFQDPSSYRKTFPQQEADSQEMDYVNEEGLDEFEHTGQYSDGTRENDLLNRVSSVIGKRLTHTSDSQRSDAYPRSNNKRVQSYRIKDTSADKYSPIKVEDDLTNFTMEKIANLKEFSKEMFIMEENEDNIDNQNAREYMLERNNSNLGNRLSNRLGENEPSNRNTSNTAKSTKRAMESGSGLSSYKKRDIPKLYDGIKPFEDRVSAKNHDQQNKSHENSASEAPRQKFTFEKEDLRKEAPEPSLVPNLNVSFTLGKNPKIPFHEIRTLSNESPNKMAGDPSSENNSPRLLVEVKNSSQGTPSDQRDLDEVYVEKMKESRIKHLIENNMSLKEKLAKQEQDLLHYNDAVSSIENLKKEIAQLQSKLHQNEIAYKTQINILKDSHKKFIPNLPAPQLQEALLQKDKTIKDLNKIIATLTKDKERVEEQLKENNISLRKSNRGKTDASRMSRLYSDDYTEHLNEATELSKIEPISSLRQDNNFGVQKILDCFSSEKTYLLLGIYLYFKDSLHYIAQNMDKEVLMAIDEIVELVERFLQKEGNLTERGSDILDQTLKVCVQISQAIHSKDLNTAGALVSDIQKIIIEECMKVESLQRIVAFTKNSNRADRRDTTSRSVVLNSSQINPKAQALKVAEIYVSDYSDEEFEAEGVEEKLAVGLILDLKERVLESNVTEEKVRTLWFNLYEEFLLDKNMAPAAQVCNFFGELGIDKDIERYQALFLRLDCLDQQTGMLNLLKLINLLKVKDNLWWKTKLHNNSFDLKYKSLNLANYLKPDNTLRLLIFDNVHRKVSNYIQNFDVGKVLQNIHKAFTQGFITKKDLRKWFLTNKLPFTKLETQIISILLDVGAKNKILLDDLDAFMANGHLTPFYSQYMEAHKDKRNDGYQEIFDEIINSLRAKVEQADELYIKQIRDIFQLKDSRFNGLMNYQQFYDCCTESNLPFSSAEEIDIVFYHLADDYKNKSAHNQASKTLQYSRFLDMIFSSRLSSKQTQNVLAKATTTDRDMKYHLVEMENELKAAHSRIEELEAKVREGKYATSVHGSPMNSNKENFQSISNASGIYKKASHRAKITSTERTLKMKVEDLEYENAKLRKALEEKLHKNDEETRRKFTKSTIVENTSGTLDNDLSNRTMKNLERKLDNLEKSYVFKEVELKSELDRLSNSKAAEIEILKKHFESEKQNFKKIIQEKNREIENFRSELEGVLTEMDSLRKKTERNYKVGF